MMVIPNGVLFPGAMLPLYIYESRYRKMLAASLQGERMFAIAMQRPGRRQRLPSSIAGLGLIRAAVDRTDGTSYLVLEGISRIELGPALATKPYRTHHISPILPEPFSDDSSKLKPLTERLRELVFDQLEDWSHSRVKGIFSNLSMPLKMPDLQIDVRQHFLNYLANLQDPGQIADFISCTFLQSAEQRQAVLEAIPLQLRLKRVIAYLQQEIKNASGES